MPPIKASVNEAWATEPTLPSLGRSYMCDVILHSYLANFYLHEETVHTPSRRRVDYKYNDGTDGLDGAR